MCGELYYHKQGRRAREQERSEALSRFRDDRALLAFLLKQELLQQQRHSTANVQEDGVRPRVHALAR